MVLGFIQYSLVTRMLNTTQQTHIRPHSEIHCHRELLSLFILCGSVLRSKDQWMRIDLSPCPHHRLLGVNPLHLALAMRAAAWFLRNMQMMVKYILGQVTWGQHVSDTLWGPTLRLRKLDQGLSQLLSVAFLVDLRWHHHIIVQTRAAVGSVLGSWSRYIGAHTKIKLRHRRA